MAFNSGTRGQIFTLQFQSYSAINIVTVMAIVITAPITRNAPRGALDQSCPVAESASSDDAAQDFNNLEHDQVSEINDSNAQEEVSDKED